MKALNKTRIRGITEKIFVNEGDVVDILESEDEEGLITIVTQSGVQGEVYKDDLGK